MKVIAKRRLQPNQSQPTEQPSVQRQFATTIPKRGKNPNPALDLLTEEISYTSSQLYGGRSIPYNPDDLVGKKGLKVYKEMMNDEQVRAAMSAKMFAVLSTGYEIVAAEPQEDKESNDEKRFDHQITDEENSDSKPTGEPKKSGSSEELVDFVSFNFEEMVGSFDSKILEILTALVYGFSCSEKVFHQIDYGPFKNKLGLKMLKTREPFFFDFEADARGNLLEDGIVQNRSLRMPPEKFVIYSYRKTFDNPYGESDLRAAYRCFSSDTEILSEDGWIELAKLPKDKKVATLNPQTDEIEYHKPIRYYRYPYRGKMFHQSGRFVDFLVTPNHRVWSAPINGDYQRNFRFIEAANLPRHYRIKRNIAKWVGVNQEYFTLPAIEILQAVGNQYGAAYSTRTTIREERYIPINQWLPLFGIWLAEGHTYLTKRGQKIVGISQSIKSPHINSIRKWIADAGFTAYEHRDKADKITFEICDAQLFEYLRPFGKSHDKFIPGEIKLLPADSLRILYDSMMAGDGRHNRDYCTVSKRLADDVSEILLKMGYAANIIIERDSSDPGRSIFIVSRNERKIDGTYCNEHADQREWIDYDGEVYCLEVPNHLVYVRRDGKACWSGNSYWSKDNIIKFMLMCLERYGEPIWVFTHEQKLDSTQVDVIKSFVKNLQSRSVITLPKSITADPKSPGERAGNAFVPVLNYLDTMIRIALLMPGLIGLSSVSEVGSFARSQTEFDAFLWILGQLRKDLESVINEQLIKQMIDLNFKVEHGMYPKFKFKQVTEELRTVQRKEWMEAVVRGVIPKNAEHVNKFLEEIGLSQLSDEEINPPQPDMGGGGFGFPFGDGSGGDKENGGGEAFPFHRADYGKQEVVNIISGNVRAALKDSLLRLRENLKDPRSQIRADYDKQAKIITLTPIIPLKKAA